MGNDLQCTVEQLTTNNAFQLSCTIDEVNANSMKITFDYDSKQLNSHTIKSFANDLQLSIEQLSQIHQIDYDFVYQLNDDSKINAEFRNPIEMIFEQCDLNPTNAAIELPNGEQLTYSQLKTRIVKNSQVLLHKFKECGREMKHDIIVPILLDMNLSVEWILTVLACGFAYSPMDLNQPLARTQLMFNKLESPFIISDHDVNGLNTLNIQDDSTEYNEYISSDQLGHSANIAYIIFTSGSTGEPKAVCVEHAQLFNFIERAGQQFNVSDKSIVTHSINTVFDVSIFNIFVTLSNGGCLVQKDEILEFVEERRTSQKLTHLILSSALFNSLRNEQLKLLRELTEWLIVGGETPSSEALKTAASSDLKISQFYGPTEATVWCTVNHYNEEFDGHNIGNSLLN